MKNDRFLSGFLVAIIILVTGSLVLFVQRGSSEAYLSEDLPQNVIHNYVLALDLRDYEKAYSYLADGDAKPTFYQFTAPFINGSLDVFQEGIEIGQAAVTSDQAVVQVSHAGVTSGLFAGFDRLADQAELTRQNGAWKIKRMSYPFFEFDWLYTPAPAPAETPAPKP